MLGLTGPAGKAASRLAPSRGAASSAVSPPSTCKPANPEAHCHRPAALFSPGQAPDNSGQSRPCALGPAGSAHPATSHPSHGTQASGLAVFLPCPLTPDQPAASVCGRCGELDLLLLGTCEYKPFLLTHDSHAMSLCPSFPDSNRISDTL